MFASARINIQVAAFSVRESALCVICRISEGKANTGIVLRLFPALWLLCINTLRLASLQAALAIVLCFSSRASEFCLVCDTV